MWEGVATRKAIYSFQQQTSEIILLYFFQVVCRKIQKTSLRCSTSILPVLTDYVSESNLSVLLFLLTFVTVKETLFISLVHSIVIL